MEQCVYLQVCLFVKVQRKAGFFSFFSDTRSTRVVYSFGMITKLTRYQLDSKSLSLKVYPLHFSCSLFFLSPYKT